MRLAAVSVTAPVACRPTWCGNSTTILGQKGYVSWRPTRRQPLSIVDLFGRAIERHPQRHASNFHHAYWNCFAGRALAVALAPSQKCLFVLTDLPTVVLHEVETCLTVIAGSVSTVTGFRILG